MVIHFTGANASVGLEEIKSYVKTCVYLIEFFEKRVIRTQGRIATKWPFNIEQHQVCILDKLEHQRHPVWWWIHSCCMDYEVFKTVSHVCMHRAHVTFNSSPPRKTAAILQTTFYNAFSRKGDVVFWFEFQRHLFQRILLKIVSIGLANGLTPKRRQTISKINAVPVPWHIYAALMGMI